MQEGDPQDAPPDFERVIQEALDSLPPDLRERISNVEVGVVRAARLARGWTQEDLAHTSGLASVQISRIERGKREVHLSTLLRLLLALEFTPEDLLAGLV